MIPRMAVEPQAFVTLSKAPAGVSGNDAIKRFKHRLVAGRKIRQGSIQDCTISLIDYTAQAGYYPQSRCNRR